jgi:hypothetical protein
LTCLEIDTANSTVLKTPLLIVLFTIIPGKLMIVAYDPRGFANYISKNFWNGS